MYIFTFSILGLEWFAYKVKLNKDNEVDMSENGTYPDYNFNNFWRAFLSVFVILTGDGWSTIYLHYYLSAGPVLSTIFFIAMIIFGNYILINVFVAILVKNFDEDSIHNSDHIISENAVRNEGSWFTRLVKRCYEKLKRKLHKRDFKYT
jgi:hypothetical protein